MNEEQRFYIRMLSPVHLGCDEVYEPMGFVVDEQSNELVAFDPLAFFRTLSGDERNRFAAICRKGTIASLLELNQFFRGRKMDGWRVSICRGFVDHYRSNLGMRPGDERRIQNELNKFSIHRTAFHANSGEPYIPGSAVKGALRTAYLNAVAKVDKNVRYDDPARSKGAAQQLEKGLLHYRDLQQDPFRLLKVSDFVPVTTRTTILYGVNEKKKPSKYDARGPYQILEVIEPGSWFVGTLSVEDGYAREAGIVRPLTRDALFQSACLFYGREKTREEEELRSADLPPFVVNWDGGIPLRIGRHSGAESLTIEGHRQIKIMQGKGRPPLTSKTGATTFWLASDVSKNWDEIRLRPFGWVCMGLMTEDMEKAAEENRIARTEAQRKVAVAGAAEAIRPEEKPEPPPQVAVQECWKDAALSWNPGTQTVTALCEGKKAATKGKDLVPPSLHKNLFDKRKTIKTDITVEKLGNAFVIHVIKGE